MSMAKAMWPFRDSHAPSWFPGPLTDVPAEHPSDRACAKEPYDCTHDHPNEIYLWLTLSTAVGSL